MVVGCGLLVGRQHQRQNNGEIRIINPFLGGSLSYVSKHGFHVQAKGQKFKGGVSHEWFSPSVRRHKTKISKTDLLRVKGAVKGLAASIA
jgi:hypothetical protein